MHRHDLSLKGAEHDLIDAVRGAGGDAQKIVGLVADRLARTLRDSGEHGAALLSAISALSAAAAHVAARNRSDMNCIAEGFLIGTMLASERTEKLTAAVLTHAAGTFVKHVYEAGGDVDAATRGLVEGAVAWAAELGFDAGEAATAVAQGAVGAGDEVRPGLGRKIRAALSEPIAGITVLLPLPKPAATVETPGEERLH